MCIFVFSYLSIVNLISDKLRSLGRTIEEAMPLFESLPKDCYDTPAENSSNKEMSNEDPTVASQFGFKNTEYVDNSLNEELIEQGVPRVWKRRNATKVILIFSLNSGFNKSFFGCLSTSTRRYHWTTSAGN
ncbi:hypothetical protein NPIL_444821 [Nephila pilipes]|uniref:Uncharacterized protein n=1 Tax=Nephila pilipes TaxID=299642 RepID=A0A8X6Q0P6_NEPPI|nr:hypothetical protein NPIL_444821 [Nephila pilipes]